MVKAFVVKTNRSVNVLCEPNKNPIYEIARLALPKGNYIISAKTTFVPTKNTYQDTYDHVLHQSLECNGHNDNDYAVMNVPIADKRGFMCLQLAISLENDSVVRLKSRALYHTIIILDAQISALSVDELKISTGHSFPTGNNYVPFIEQNGNGFIQNDYMDWKDENLFMESISRGRSIFTEALPIRKSTWLGRLIEGIYFLTKKV